MERQPDQEIEYRGETITLRNIFWSGDHIDKQWAASWVSKSKSWRSHAEYGEFPEYAAQKMREWIDAFKSKEDAKKDITIESL